MRLLEVLATEAGRVVPRDELIARIWAGVVVTDDSLVQCVGDIRRALGADHALLHTVPRVGYRLDAREAAAVAPSAGPPPSAPPPGPRASDGSPLPDGAVAPARADPRPARLRAPPRWSLAALGALLLVAAIWADHAGMLGEPAPAARSDESPEPALLVHVRSDAAQADSALASGMSQQLLDDLSRNTRLRLAAASASESDDAVIDRARRLHVGFLLDAVLHAQVDELHLTARLIDIAHDKVMWTERSASTATGLRADREALIRRVRAGTGTRSASAGDAIVLPATPASMEAWRLVTRAQSRVARFDRSEYLQARQELDRAIALDPRYALARAVRLQLDALDATARITGETADERHAALVAQAERAVASDPQLALAHQARSLALLAAGRRDEALQAALQARALSPDDPMSDVVVANALIANGRMRPALEAIERAQARTLEPSVLLDFVRAKMLWGNDRLEEARASAASCLERAPQFAACRAMRAVASDAMGRLEAAREDLKAYRRAAPGPGVESLGPGSYGVPKLQNEWLAQVRQEIGLP
jgi:tetratricopeptide (TPR) repeat protein/TolB-like protein